MKFGCIDNTSDYVLDYVLDNTSDEIQKMCTSTYAPWCWYIYLHLGIC